MTLYKLKTAPVILVNDDNNTNILPLVLELTQFEKNKLNIFCYEQPTNLWRNVFKGKPVTYYEDFQPDFIEKCTSSQCSIVIDSVNQMAICLGWSECLKYLKILNNNPNVMQLILILHKDCLVHSSKLNINLNHIANAIISYDTKDHSKVLIQLKKGGKFSKSEEKLSYDNNTHTLMLSPIVKEGKKIEDPEKPLPSNLSTFKIEMEQTDKLEKYKLKLPYMSKINDGESKVYYEPDAVDDWDDEDPDDDLDI